MISEAIDLNAYQTTDEPKEVLTAEKIEELENSDMQRFKEGTIEKVDHEASSLGQGGYGKVDEHSGMYSYRIPIHVPRPQNNGPIPAISLVYNSRGSNSPSLLAAGWRLELGHIERVPEEGGYIDFENDQGMPGAKTHFVIQLNNKNFTLVKVQGKDHVFRSKIENAFIEAERFLHKSKLDPDSGKPVIDYWELRDADGKLYKFGVEGDQEDVPGEVENRIWNITSIESAYGQKVEYEYEHYIKPGSPYAGHEKSYSYPSCVKIGMTKERNFWDTEIRFSYRKDDALIPNEGYYFLDTEYTGREESGIVAVIWKRLVAVETYYKNEDGKMNLSRRLEIDSSIHEGREKFRLNSLNEVAFKNGEVDPSTKRPPHRFEYIWKDPENPALMYKSTTPLNKVEEIEYDLATNVDNEAFGVDGIYLITSFTERADEELWKKSYKYLGGKLYTPFGEYRGHKKVVAYDEETKHTTETLYTQTGVHNGYILKQYKRDADNKLITTLENTWMALNYYGGRYMPFTCESIQKEFSEDGKTVLSTVYTQIPKKSVRENPWEYAVDKYGNALIQFETTYEGDKESGRVILRKKTETLYKNIDTGKQRFIGLPEEIKKYAKSGHSNEYQQVEWTVNKYNDKGQVIEHITHYDRDNAERVYKNTTEYHEITGNVTKKYRYDGSQKLLVEDIRYYSDGSYKFMKSHWINAKGQEEKFLQYDLQFRSPSYVIGIDNSVTLTSYDGIGRTIEEIYAGQDPSQRDDKKESVRYVYTITPQERIVETVFIHTDTRTKEYYDQLVRKYKVLKTGYQGKWIVSEHTEYDHRTRKPARLAEPYYINGSSPGYSTIEYDDPRLRVTREINPGGGVELIKYDGLKETHLIEVYDRDENGNKGELLHTQITEEKLKDALKRVTKRAEGHENSQTRYELHYDYDVADRLRKVRDNFGITLKIIDYGCRLDDKPISTFDLNLGMSEMEYDGLGRLELIKYDFNEALDRLSVIKYDELDRIVEQIGKNTISGDTRVIKKKYDTAPHGIGQLAQQNITEINSLGRYIKREEFIYDNFGLPSSVAHEWDIDWPDMEIKQVLGVTIGYEYNGPKGGRLERISYPSVYAFPGSEVKYLYDDLSGVVGEIRFNDKSVWKVGDTGFTARDQVKDTIIGNGIETKYDYEPKTGLIKELCTQRDSEILLKHLLTFDTSDNLRMQSINTVILNKNGVEKPFINSMRSYTYNDKNQLVSALEDGKKQNYYYYKANGSRTKFQNGESEILYSYDDTSSHQIILLSGTKERSLSYDKAGNLVEDINTKSELRRQFFWNSSNKLQNIDFLDVQQNRIRRICYGYNGDNARVLMYDSLHDRLTFYADYGFEIQWCGNKNRIITHILNGTRRVSTFDQEASNSARMYYYHRDHLNSVIIVTDETGYVMSSAFYEPFGKIITESGDYKPDILYTGHRADVVDYEGFQNFDFKARVYEPELGVFISPDEVEDKKNAAFGLNRYIYVNNNPTSRWDPSGNQEEDTPKNDKEIKDEESTFDLLLKEMKKSSTLTEFPEGSTIAEFAKGSKQESTFELLQRDMKKSSKSPEFPKGSTIAEFAKGSKYESTFELLQRDMKKSSKSAEFPKGSTIAEFAKGVTQQPKVKKKPKRWSKEYHFRYDPKTGYWILQPD